MNKTKITILIVNGGKDPAEGKWIKLCVEKILQTTERNDYRILVWNNNVYDNEVKTYLKSKEIITYIEANPIENLSHPHAVPLQRLYFYARQYSPEYIVVMDSDAHPIRKGWLEELINNINEKKVLSGIWRDELNNGIKPYIHPSCLCTTVNFIEKKKLRLDFIEQCTKGRVFDTMSSFTETVDQSDGLEHHKLKRSNINNFHRLIGGIYGDYIYHHGAGTREKIEFWDEDSTPRLQKSNKQISQIASKLLFKYYDDYIDWLRGKNKDDTIPNLLGIGEIKELKRQYFKKKIRHLISLIKKPIFRMNEYILIKRASKKELQHPIQFNYMEKPFTVSDLYPLPEKWGWSQPTFVGVGVPKAGTSWWYSLLLQHSQVLPHRLFNPTNPTSKELHYFTHYTFRSIGKSDICNYHKAFPSFPGCISGEFTTTYLHHPVNINNLHNAAPNAKIIVILRDPVERMLSHMNHLLKNRAKYYEINTHGAKMSFFKKYSIYPEAYYFSLYANAVKNLLKRYKRERILFLQYERCVQNTEKEIRKTFDFLDIDNRFNVKNISKPVNKQEHIIDELSINEKIELASQFDEDINELKKLVPEFDYKLWSNFY